MWGVGSLQGTRIDLPYRPAHRVVIGSFIAENFLEPCLRLFLG
jgi:hypothetical protein